MPTDRPDLETLAARGIFTYETFAPLANEQVSYLVDGLLTQPSVNILVGDSGLGKTALGIMLGLCVAAGIPFLGRATRPGLVFYCDAESGKAQFYEMVGTISHFLGLSRVPDTFLFWSPVWDPEVSMCFPFSRLTQQVGFLQPDLTILDPLRPFYGKAESKSEEAISLINALRSSRKTSWLVTHHRRKPSLETFARLEDDPYTWLRESAGSYVLINNTDTRLGLEPSVGTANAELVLGGFVRTAGPMPPILLAREYDPLGQPRGYVALTGKEVLNDRYRQAFDRLPETFRFADVKRALGGSSGSATARCLQQCEALGLIRRSRGAYSKVPKGDGLAGPHANGPGNTGMNSVQPALDRSGPLPPGVVQAGPGTPWTGLQAENSIEIITGPMSPPDPPAQEAEGAVARR